MVFFPSTDPPLSFITFSGSFCTTAIDMSPFSFLLIFYSTLSSLLSSALSLYCKLVNNLKMPNPSKMPAPRNNIVVPGKAAEYNKRREEQNSL
jgi:hypothetical protein